MAIIPAESLAWRCDPGLFQIQSTADLELTPMTTVGQERALNALHLGTELDAPGYNIFVCGITGTGRLTTVKKILDDISTKCTLPPDRCYVHNFKDPSRPILLTLPTGRGREFRADMEEFVKFLRTHLPRLFEDESFTMRKRAFVEQFERDEKHWVLEFERELAAEGFKLAQVRTGEQLRPEILILVDGQVTTLESLVSLVQEGRLSEERATELANVHKEKRHELESHLRQSRRNARQVQKQIGELERAAAKTLINGSLADLKEKHGNAAINDFVDLVQEAVLAGLDQFKHPEARSPLHSILGTGDDLHSDLAHLLQVNVIHDSSQFEGFPVVIENTPTYTNIFGTIERTVDRAGATRTDFTRIRAGSLLRADGGYLVLNAADAVSEPAVWRTLKRTLRTQSLEIQPFDTLFQLTPFLLKPQAIPVKVKVILIGESHLYDLLYVLDEDFRKIFKVKADFDTEMDRTEENIRTLRDVVKRLCVEENLLPVHATGLARVAEDAARRASTGGKLSCRFSDLADIVREAHFHAREGNRCVVDEEMVERAVRAREDRHALLRDKLRERMLEGKILVTTQGKRVGQVNGLSVYQLPSLAFGSPARITATVSAGRAGIINIEREAKLSGKTHNKAVLILSAWLRSRFATRKPLSVAATLCFEQSYSGVEGDSATIAETTALLSALTGIGVRQDLAVTGSLSQKGDVQPVGGINEKVEGFFEICREQGLTATQGVVIPARNVPDLQLREEVIAACRRGDFAIHAVDRVEEAIELLVEMPFGDVDDEGRWTVGSIGERAAERLEQLAAEERKKADGLAESPPPSDPLQGDSHAARWAS
ncbi:MAG: ATP-binding protein [Planctomycetota bacterium]